MTWTLETSCGNESAKIRWDALRYCRGSGLDLGCGPERVFNHSIGIDANSYGTPAGPSLVMDCRDLSVFADGKFDYLYSSHFLEHVADAGGALSEWWRVLKVGGYLVLYLPHKNFYPNIGQPGANPDHKHDFLPGDIIALMRGLGGWDLLENEERNGGNEYSFFQVYQKRADSLQAEPYKTKPAKTAGIVRPGNFGDAVWATSVAAQLKREGYHITAYVELPGEMMLQNNPHIDEIVVMDRGMFYQLPDLFRYIESRAAKHHRFIDFTQAVENNLLMHPEQSAYRWPREARRSQCARNYVEFMHQLAGVPYQLNQRVYLTDTEKQWARNEIEGYSGRVVVLANTGSTAPKWWPYGPAFAQIMASIRVHVVVVGDLRGLHYTESPYTHVVGMNSWSMRQSIAFAVEADAVVGQETGLLNAVACESVAKVVMLSHSTEQNLTRDWLNTRSLHGQVACYPCHQIHFSHNHCPQDAASGAAQCQREIKIESVVEALISLGVLSEADLAELMRPQPITVHKRAA